MTDNDRAEEIGTALADAFDNLVDRIALVPPISWLDRLIGGIVTPPE